MNKSRWLDIKNIGQRFVAPKKFLEANGFTKCVNYHYEYNLEKILRSGTFASWGFSHQQEKIPYADHSILYKNPKTKTCCLVYLPYNLADDIRKEITEWANSRNLKAVVYEKSWYSDTCLVIVSTPEKDIIVT